MSPDRVQVWAAQLAANDFPPVCAMSGRPAETWRKFRFATPPTWAYALLVFACLGGIGFIGYAVVMAAIAQRASGYLPLTKTSRLILNLAFWVPLALLGLWIGLWVVAAFVGLPSNDSARSAAGAVLLWFGLLLLVVGVFGRLVITRLVGPRARVREQLPGQYDRIVELRNVHPAFVAAVQAVHGARLAAHQELRVEGARPSPPGSN